MSLRAAVGTALLAFSVLSAGVVGHRQPASAAVTGDNFVPLPVARIADTRTGQDTVQAPVGPGKTITVQITGTAGIPTTGTSTIALNIAVIGPTATGTLTAYPDTTTRPLPATINFTQHQTAQNTVLITTGTTGKISLFNNSTGTLNLAIDTYGYCAAVDANGNAFVFNGDSWTAPESIDPGGRGLTAVSCAAVGHCVAVSLSGDALTKSPSGMEDLPAHSGRTFRFGCDHRLVHSAGSGMAGLRTCR